MQKEFEKQEKLKALDEEHKKQMVKDMEEQEKKHKQHDPVTALMSCSLPVFGLTRSVSCDTNSQFVIL
jgi:hypothetical protein